MLTTPLLAGAIGALTWAMIRLDERSSMAPDSQYYALIAQGERVPRPFCGRYLLPMVLGLRIRLWVIMVFACFVVGSMAMSALAGGSLVAAALWVWLPNTRFHLRHPVLNDLPGIVLPMAAAAWLPTEGTWGSVSLILAALVIGAIREWGVVWLAILTGNPIAIVGFAATFIGYARWGRPAEDGRDNDFIGRPFQAVTTYRMGHLLNWKLMLLPWGMVLPLALLHPDFPWWVFLVAYAPLVIATDHARLYLYAAPVLIQLAVMAPIPDMLWAGVVLAHIFNPYRGA